MPSVAANISNKQSRITENVQFFAWGLGGGLATPRFKSSVLRNIMQSLLSEIYFNTNTMTAFWDIVLCRLDEVD